MHSKQDGNNASTLRMLGIATLLALLVAFIYSAYQRVSLAQQFEQYVPVGSPIPAIQENMASKGFSCSQTGEKEVFCLNKERIGPGLSNDFWRFIAGIFPNAVYPLLPKGDDSSSTYRREEVTFALDGGLVADVHAEILLAPQ